MLKKKKGYFVLYITVIVLFCLSILLSSFSIYNHHYKSQNDYYSNKLISPIDSHCNSNDILLINDTFEFNFEVIFDNSEEIFQYYNFLEYLEDVKIDNRFQILDKKLFLLNFIKLELFFVNINFFYGLNLFFIYQHLNLIKLFLILGRNTYYQYTTYFYLWISPNKLIMIPINLDIKVKYSFIFDKYIFSVERKILPIFVNNHFLWFVDFPEILKPSTFFYLNTSIYNYFLKKKWFTHKFVNSLSWYFLHQNLNTFVIFYDYFKLFIIIHSKFIDFFQKLRLTNFLELYSTLYLRNIFLYIVLWIINDIEYFLINNLTWEYYINFSFEFKNNGNYYYFEYLNIIYIEFELSTDNIWNFSLNITTLNDDPVKITEIPTINYWILLLIILLIILLLVIIGVLIILRNKKKKFIKENLYI